MTTNQTINGMPRELLENLASYAEGSASVQVQMWVTKLRALLDAPMPEVNDEQWYADTPDGDSALVTRVVALCKHPSMSFHQVPLLEGAISESKTHSRPTAQPQGGQVIDLNAVDWEAIQKAADESNWMPNEYMRNEWVADVCNFLKYGRAEQPAPVAVVMPERMEVPSADCPERINAQGWNACLDQLKRLNPSL